MNRRDFLKLTGASLLGGPSALRALAPDDRFAAYGQAACPASGKRPNVILVLCDDLGWGDIGLFWQNARAAEGRPHIATPHIDKAIRGGVMLTHAYTASPVCAPARASLVSGKNQGHCSLRDNMFDRPVDVHMTLGTVMKQAGYATWHLGKWGVGGGYESNGEERRSMACDAGFDYSYGYPGHGHGHSFYHWEGDTRYDWSLSKSGSPIVENVSAAVYDGSAGMDWLKTLSAPASKLNLAADEFLRDDQGEYYRRLISDEEVRYCYDTDLFTAKLKQLIVRHQEACRAAGAEQPFFCFACYTTVHGSGSTNSQGDDGLACRLNFHVPGKPYPALDDGDETWGGGVNWEKNASGHLTAIRNTYDSAGNACADTSNTWAYAQEGQWTADAATAYNAKQRYATNVQRLDDALGDLLHFLKIRGIDKDTLFIFTSDNGPATEYLAAGSGWNEAAYATWIQGESGLKSNGPFSGMKRWAQEGGVREPTFAYWPGTIPGAADGTAPRESTVPFQFPAWMATLADVAGLPQPAHCDGVSVLPALTGQGTQLPARVYSEYSSTVRGYSQMVRDGNYVLIREQASSASAAVSLYDVVADPDQSDNLAARPEQADRVRWMSGLFVSCRIPAKTVTAACGAAQAYHQSPAWLESAAIPAQPAAGPVPPASVRLYREGAEAWPWVPNFRTLLPEESFLAALSEVRGRLPGAGAYGISVRGWIDVGAEGEVAFSAEGAGGCQLWIHEAHILEYEAGDCTGGRTASLKLAKGRHPFRLYLTTAGGTDGLCAVSAGTLRLV